MDPNLPLPSLCHLDTSCKQSGAEVMNKAGNKTQITTFKLFQTNRSNTTAINYKHTIVTITNSFAYLKKKKTLLPSTEIEII